MSTRTSSLLSINIPAPVVSQESTVSYDVEEINEQITDMEFEQHLEDADTLLGVAKGLEAIHAACTDPAQYDEPLTKTALTGLANQVGLEALDVSTENKVTETIERIYKAIKKAIEMAIATVVIWVLKLASRGEDMQERLKNRLKQFKDLDEADIQVSIDANLEALAIEDEINLDNVVEVSRALIDLSKALTTEGEKIAAAFTKAEDAKSIIAVEEAIDDLVENVIMKYIPMRKFGDGYESKDILPGNARLVVDFRQSQPVFFFKKEEKEYKDLSLMTTAAEAMAALEAVAGKATYANLNNHLNSAKDNGVSKTLENRISKFDSKSNDSAYAQSFMRLGARVNTAVTVPAVKISRYITGLADQLDRVTKGAIKATEAYNK